MAKSWEEYKSYRVKKKKEEKEEKKRQVKSIKQSTNQNNQQVKTQVTQQVNQNNASAFENILKSRNTLDLTNNNKTPILTMQDRKQEVLKQIQESANKKRNNSSSNNTMSLWDKIKEFAGDIERIDKNIGEGISNGLKDLGGMIYRARQKEIIQRDSSFLGTGVNNKIENTNDLVTKTLTNSVNKAKENIDDFDAKRMEEKAKSQKRIDENISKQSNAITKKIAELSPSIGNMGVGMIASTVNPIVGTAYFTGSAAGSYYYDAIDRGMTKEQAEKYGMIMGSLEGVTEMIGVGNIKKGGKAIKTLASGGGKVALKTATSETVKTGTKEALKNFGIGIADNFMQESIMEPLQELTAQTTGGKDKANWENMGKRMLQSGIDGALTSIIMSGADAGSNICIGLEEKIQNGKKLTQQDIQQGVKDAEKVGVDVKKVSEENLLRERDKIINEIQSNKQEENTSNQVANEETKTPQNRTSQVETQAKADLSDKLSKIRQFYDENTYNQMKNFIETAPSQEALNQINEDIKTETKNKLEEVYKSEKFTESQSRKQTYAKYQRQNNTKGIEYNNDIVNNALDAVTANRNGRRTVGQWRQVAEQIGLEASNLSKSEIDNIAYGSWFELQPTKNITKYDNRTKEYKGFEKFTSDDWVNTIYESAKGQKIQQLDTVLSSNIEEKQNMIVNNQSQTNSEVDIQQQLDNEINTAIQDKMSKGKISLGKVADNLVNKVKSVLGIDITNRTHVLTDNDIRHMLNEHGDPKVESKKGQIAITEKDISKIPDIINNYDDIIKGNPNKNGETIRYIKSYEDGTTYLVEVVPETSKTLNIKTMWKKPTSLANHQEPSLTSKTQPRSDTSTSNNSIPQNKQNVKSDNTNINNMQQTQENIQENEEVNPYRNTAKANKLIKEKNEKISQLEKDLQSVVSKDAKTSIQNQINKIEKQYNDKIQTLYNETNNAQENQKKLTRKEVRKKLLKEMNVTIDDIQAGKDITSLNFQFTDPTRVNEKVFGRELGQKINDATINKTKHNTAEKTRWLNQERNDIQDLGIKARSKESSAVQKYGEKQYVDKNGDLRTYGDDELAKEFPNIKTQEKIKHASEVIRQKYDTYIDQINEVLTSLGYDAIPKRQDYMRHFQELGDVFSQTGIPFNLNDMKAEDLPTDINGLTEFNKPGKNWFAQAQKRYGNKTTYDAITGIDGYLEGAGNLIFHTEDIQNYRALSELIRETYGQTKGFDNLDGLTNEQLQKRIEDIQSNKLSKYVAWLDEQANSLAGKKGAIDRGVERALGRRAYKVMNTLKSQVGSNMTGFNVRSALTNFISSTIGMAKTNKIAGARGLVSTVNNIFKNDGFINKSDFLTRRFGSDSLSQKTWQKVSNAGQIFMNGTDYFTANLITRSKYFEGLQKGMSEQQAIKFADDFAERVMGDRSQGATAEVFNSKTLGLLTQFQLEVNNQWQYMIHDTKMDFQKNAKTKGYLKAGATAVFQLGQLAGYSWLFNNMFEALTGSRSAFDPIEIIKTLFGIDDDDDDKEEKSFDKRMAEATEMLVDNIPLGNIVTGGGRIPISEAFQGISTLGKKLTNQKNKYGGDISWEDVGKDTLGALPYFALPTGYGQIRKTVQGLTTVANGGDYTINKKGNKELKFPVENKNAGDYIKSGLFGKYSLPLAKVYVKNDFDRLSEKQTKMYEESKLPYKELLEYTKQGFKKQEEKIDYLSSKKMTEQQKWGIYKNDIFSNTERKDGGSQVKDAEYITSNGISKTEYINLYNTAHKNNIDMPTTDEYKELKKNNIQLKNYIDYTVKAKKLLQEKKKNGELDENQQLKASDKCKLLLDSNYSTAEKKGIYSQLVEKKDTLYSNLNKLTNLDINAYLDYKMQDIKGDEDKDSEIEGATEFGTKKKNFIEYLNSSKLSGMARLYIYGKQYKYNSYQQNKMREYIYNSNLSSQEKLEVTKELSKNVEKHKDGKYYWVKPAKK